MRWRFSAGVTKHRWFFWGKRGLADRTDHRFAAACATSATSGWFMVAKGEVLRVVHMSSLRGALEWSSADGFPTYRSYTGSITSGVLLAGELILGETW
jgi:hypothetical protein